MTRLTHPVTGHEVNTDDESVDFWESVGYTRPKPESKKTPAKKAASSKNSK